MAPPTRSLYVPYVHTLPTGLRETHALAQTLEAKLREAAAGGLPDLGALCELSDPLHFGLVFLRHPHLRSRYETEASPEPEPTVTPEQTLLEAGINDARQANYQRKMSALLTGRA